LNKLKNMQAVKSQVIRIKKERERLSAILPEIKVVEMVYPSDANFLLVKVKNANDIYNRLVTMNIIVRNRNAVIGNCLRITIGKRSENDKLIDAFNEIAKI